MNRIYRLVWNRALRTVQVASELTGSRQAHVASAATTVLRSRPLALAVAGLLLSSVALPAFADCTPTNVIDCGAPGGADGHPGRNMPGATGDGTGGSATHRDTGGTSVATGDATSNGNGGKGADGIESSTDPATVATGGAGGLVGGTGSAALAASVTGGAGQAGASPPTSADFWAGGGGGGGAGVFINDAASNGHVATGTVIGGGNGGAGGNINSVENGDAGGGGGGGAGVIVGGGAGNVAVGVDGRLQGGQGGAGGNVGYAGGGGGGGDALLVLGLGANITVNAGASLQGGTGGLAGAPSPFDPGTGAGGQSGGYGGGGAGANLVGAGAVLNNTGSISGGGAGGAGVAGVGLRAWGGAGVTTGGSIQGGINGNGVRSDAVLFSGGGNLLTIVAGASFVGNIESISGSTNGGDALSLNGTAAGSINAGQIIGFASLRKDGSSTWTLTGTGNAGSNWTVRSGTLVGDSNSFAGNITFNALAGTPSVQFSETADGTYGGVISGTGNLVKTGAGKLTLSGNISGYSGQFDLNQGVVALSGAGDMHGAEITGSNLQLDISGVSGPTATVAGLSGSGIVNLGSRTLIFNNPANDSFGGVIQGTGGITLNSGTQTLTGANSYSGDTDVLGGTLRVTGAGQLGQGSALDVIGGTVDVSGKTAGSTLEVATLAGNGNLLLGATTLQVDAGNSNFLGQISGSGGVTVNGGLLTLTGNNSYSGDTLVQNGGLDLVGNGTAGLDSRVVLNNSTFDLRGVPLDSTVTQSSLAGSGTVRLGQMTLRLDNANDTFSGVISGSGNLAVTNGREVLDGNNTYTGTTTVGSNGTLIVGDSGSNGAAIAGNASVTGGTLGGSGTVHGSVTVSAGGTLAPGDIASLGTLTIGGDLIINSGSQLDFDLAAPGPNFSTPGQGDHIVVNGNLSIDASSLNVSDLGMGPGLYNLFKWGGTLQFNNGGFQPPQGMSLQVLSTDKQINLIDTQGFTLDQWDANNLAGPGSMGGGSGTWSLSASNWTDMNADAVGPMSPVPGFAVFGGASGTVTVDNTDGSVSALGMQFASDGYRLTGDALTLVGQNGAAPIIRVSDGATAIIDNLIDGNNGINKTDGGTLVLNGANIYTGNTVLSGGELSVSSDLNLGAASNALDFEGGTLQVTGNSYHSTARNIIWGATGGGFDIADASNTFTVSQNLGGTGGLYKTGAGTLALTGINSYTGLTTIAQGTLQVNSSSLLGAVLDNGILSFVQPADGLYSGGISGSGQLLKSGAGTLTLTGTNTYTGGTVIAAGALQGSTSSLQGNVVDNGQLIFNQANDGSFAGTVLGSGQLVKNGTGNVSLTGANSYTGGTIVNGGTLTGDSGSLQGNIVNQSIVAFAQNADGSFAGAMSGSGLLVKSGSGVLTLAGANSYSGGTEILAGTLQGDSSSLQGNIDDESVLVFAQNVNGTFAGEISGSGQLVKNGGGVLTLTGANIYGGGTLIHAGTLQGDSTSLHGDMVDNAALSFVQATDGVFAGAVSGTGQLLKSGSGNLTLTGANSYSGGTVISAGTLSGDTTSLQGSIANNATLAFEQAADGTFNGAISGSGQLIKNGAGTLALNGVNTYSGGTLVSNGTLQGDTTSLQGAITDNSKLEFAQAGDGTFNGAISGDGQLIKSGAGTLTLLAGNSYSGGTVINGGTLQGDSGSLFGVINDNARLVFAQQGDGIFNGTLTGTGQLLKNGDGTLVLDDINSFSGSTEVAAGKLVVGDDTHASASLAGVVTVDSGATLGGIGTIGGLDLSGTLTPGNSIGTLNVAGNATFRPGSSYQFEVSPDGSSDRLAATGSVSILGGSALALANNGNWAPQTQFQIITATGGISGQFDSVSSSLAFLTPSLSYAANAVTLQLQRNDIDFADVAQTRNQRAVASAIEPLGFANPLYKTVVGLDAPTARAGFDAMSGEQFASTRSALIDDSRYVRDAIDRHLLGLSNDGAQATDTRGVTAWTSAWGHWGNNDSDGNAARLSADGSGLLVGADLGVGSDARLGAVVGHSQATARVDDRGSDAHTTGTDFGLYGDVSFGGFALRGGLAYAWQQIDSHRNVAFGDVAESLNDRYDAHVAQAFVEGGYRFQLTPGQQLEPFLNLARVQLQTDASRESGGAAALAVAGANDGVSIATLGLRDSWSLSAAGGLNAHLGLGWQQAWGDVTPVSSMRFASGSQSFDIAGTPIGRHAGVIDGGLSFAVTRNVSVDASYIGRFGDDAKDQGARMSLTVLW